jgi:hypothetical protein
VIQWRILSQEAREIASSLVDAVISLHEFCMSCLCGYPVREERLSMVFSSCHILGFSLKI